MKKLAGVFILIFFYLSLASGVTHGETIKDRLVDFVAHTIYNLKYSAYKFGGNHFDAAKGVYVLDCSAYVDNLLASIHPDGYFDIVDTLGTDRPTTHDYYTFFKSLTKDGTSSWNLVKKVEELEAGDILVFRYKNKKNTITRGHVMVVMDTPVRDFDIYSVRVADSAPIKHSQDTRAKKSGIGIGTLLLKVNPDGKPYALAWSEGAKWRKNVNFAMARPIEA